MTATISLPAYLVNDLGVRERDRLHPEKRNPPIAAALVTPRTAVATATALAGGAGVIGAVLGTTLFVALVACLGLTFAYSRGLKNVPFLELVIIAAGFVLRVAAVAVLSYIGWAFSTRLSVAWSGWLVASVAAFLVAAQRGVTKVLRGLGGDPTELILGDRVIPLAGAATSVLALIGLYA